MKMELLDNGCLKVLLTEEDLQALGLTFDSMDTTNMATQEAIQSLLLTARHETGFDPSMGLVVEALPVDGGCLLLFTPVCTRRRIRLKKAVGPYIYEAEDIEQLFRLVFAIISCRVDPSSPGQGAPSTSSATNTASFSIRLRRYLRKWATCCRSLCTRPGKGMPPLPIRRSTAKPLWWVTPFGAYVRPWKAGDKADGTTRKSRIYRLIEPESAQPVLWGRRRSAGRCLQLQYPSPHRRREGPSCR